MRVSASRPRSPLRRIVAWTSLTLDGHTNGPDGPARDTWQHEHALQPQTADYFEGTWRGADAILLGRNNFEDLCPMRPAMTRDEKHRASDP
ncbi:MAG: hypothetical protein H0U15_08375 [Geodermatophilaceae bacterium]|nr:hypothetical protein [Geodermatophilaceae bacterium]